MFSLVAFAVAADSWVAPTVTVTRITASAPLTEDATWDAVTAVGPGVVACFGDPAAPVPASVTGVDVGWTGAKAGAPEGITVALPAETPTLSACLTRALGAVRVPDTGAASRVQVHLTVGPTSPTAGSLGRADPAPDGSTPSQAQAGGSAPPRSPIGGMIGARGTSMGSGNMSVAASSFATMTVEAVSGEVDERVVVARVESQHESAAKCWTEARKTDSKVKGRVKFSVSFGASGSVRRVQVTEDSAQSAALVACLRGVVESVDVGAAGGATLVVDGWRVIRQAGQSALGDPAVVGTLDAPEVVAVGRQSAQKLFYCHQRALTEAPTLAGSVLTAVSIDRTGVVTDARTVSTTLQNAEVEACVRKAFTEAVFPPSPRGGTATWPILFQPGK